MKEKPLLGPAGIYYVVLSHGPEVELSSTWLLFFSLIYNRFYTCS